MDANSSIIAVLTPCGYASSARHRIRVLLRAHLPDPAGLRPARHTPRRPRRTAAARSSPGRAWARQADRVTRDLTPATDPRSGARRAAVGPRRVRRDDGVSATQGRPPGRHRPALRAGALGERARHDLGAERRRPIGRRGRRRAADGARCRDGAARVARAGRRWILGASGRRQRMGCGSAGRRRRPLHPCQRRSRHLDAETRLAGRQASRHHRHRRLRLAR